MSVSTSNSTDRIAAHAPILMQVTGLNKQYGDQHALAGVSFEVRAREIVGLIGPNGAGKTTLLEAIAGLLPIDDGHVLWRGVSLPLARRREFIFYLPDGLRPWEDQYVPRVLEFFAATYGRPKGWVAETVSAVGLEPVL